MSGFAEAIRLEEQLSSEARAWERQKRLLENEIEVLRSELAETRRRTESIRSERSEARERREELLAQLKEEESSARELAQLVGELAPSLNNLLARLPGWASGAGPYPEGIDPSESPITVLRLLREIQAENSQIGSRTREITDPESGETYRVDVLSFGLGAGFFASEDGAFGGRFVYDGENWNPEIILQFSERIRHAIQQEKGAAEPGLTDLPISIEGQP